jgi:hypothetical protein
MGRVHLYLRYPGLPAPLSPQVQVAAHPAQFAGQVAGWRRQDPPLLESEVWSLRTPK